MKRREFIDFLGGAAVAGGRNAMRLLYAICLLAAAVVTSVAAADGDTKLKQEIESINAAYASSFNSQDAAGVAAVFTRDGIYISSAGARTDIANIYQNVWKTGFDHLENTVDQVWPLSNDIVLSSGEYRTSGKNKDGAAIEIAGRWSAVDVREDGKWKIRMLSVMRKQP